MTLVTSQLLGADICSYAELWTESNGDSRNGWAGLQGELLLQMQDIILDEYMFRCFTDSLKPYTGKVAEPDIITWIAKNHVGNICLAIRRFDDHDGRTVSLRRLLIEMRDSADIITAEKPGEVLRH